ncbi:Mitochondrial substrate carrier family protein Q [Hondaea fermentalgiana]|uniref:Mitochondrial substrate carrier family protein Q n=1 Tax=Hondaea fermentalgiana TaxID=2315210 RepID=A0A2R5GLV3_9STRA|nr:Mitochondrial substrate carrier family protein Q [Hondaea fermentalgiana]|eukprot:GBG31860.1 Mitochondrial substrate carrier family protein Q [Hondaea fermentalgiana]
MGAGKDGHVNTLLSRTTLAHAVSGSVGSVLAMMLTYPLDRVRTMKQLSRGGKEGGVVEVLRSILEKEGWHGLYAGLQPMLVALGASNFVYFYWFTALRAGLQYLARKSKPRGALADPNGPISNLLLASVAGTLNVLLTTPLWVAYTRLAVQMMSRSKAKAEARAKAAAMTAGEKDNATKPAAVSEQANKADDKDAEPQYTGMLDAMRKIAERDGAASLWSGLGPSLILVSNPSVQFASYEWLKHALLKFRLKMEPTTRDLMHIGEVMEGATEDVVSEAVLGTELSSIEYLLLGATAKLIATVVTYPLQVAQTRLRAEANKRKALAADRATGSLSADQEAQAAEAESQAPLTTLSCLRKIYHLDGIPGLFAGMEAKLLQTCLTSAFMFAAYEQICAIILRFILWRKVSSKQSA